MARITGGLGTSHVPMIGRTIAAGTQAEVSFAPFFDGYVPVHRWLGERKPDVAIVFYNDHGLNFALDNMPTFAIGAAGEYRNADEGWGEPEPRSFRGAPELSWHLIQSLVADEFDPSVCREMLFDHAGITALDLLYPGHDVPVAVIPIVINAVQPPLPTPLRCYKLGQAIGRAVASFGQDIGVLIVGSGGLSHELGEFGKINQPFDRMTMDKIVADPEALTRYTNDEIVDLAGAQGLELMTWIAMRGAVAGAVDVVSSVYHAPISHTGGAMMLIEPKAEA
ncbi:class III extradiol dioxygenase family protein [Sphingomonas sp. AOB5]|uniref:class III extradiol dioxygenase family protein n=1 Tax=Sphingomonas sp. AOB5 TaxID=3034017 RepID=UPI0023F62264|nr:class III extradiol dioxygenase family protein [Sphingomonas sp. AOB5]MDF7775312.1 class III extradiol dioxygenase family protein [Sphingomonas sp. AOB5]